jgi:hypothetical protein
VLVTNAIDKTKACPKCDAEKLLTTIVMCDECSRIIEKEDLVYMTQTRSNQMICMECDDSKSIDYSG